MTELLPTRVAEQLRSSLVDYLTTTFALSDQAARESLTSFLNNQGSGLFRGPYLRARAPFRPADDGWREHLGWYEGHPPYGHQAAAFARLSSAHHAPEPTLVVTGTGSGKTEAFLHPIIDHVLRVKSQGDTGVKALILYPMNALANDQAGRIAGLISTYPELAGITAALYTGEQSGVSTKIPGLITDRHTIRQGPPDILLTNYKMLDQMLLRPEDQPILAAAALSLQYLVLDEFHTYDGAQGTDVAMLLRRLGLSLRRYRPPASPLPTWAETAPLGTVTPVATSATLGDEGDTSGMRSFAETVFGIPFAPESVITETRLTIAQWVTAALAAAGPAALPRGITADATASGAMPITATQVNEIGNLALELEAARPEVLAHRVLAELFDGGEAIDWAGMSDAVLNATVASHPLVQRIAEAASAAIHIDELAEAILPSGLGSAEDAPARDRIRRACLTVVFATLSHVRARVGRAALSIDVNLWVRELTRIDRAASADTRFRWADDGPELAELDADAKLWQPALYCRHCGRSGWGVELSPIGTELALDQSQVRVHHMSKEHSSRFRALMYAPAEALAAESGEIVEDLAWFDAAGHRPITMTRPDVANAEQAEWLPVLTHIGDDADELSRNDECPACQGSDGIRFLGSAMATILSVLITTIFGDPTLGEAEKKALVFTDSVQDAAHRAAFVQSRAHAFSLRNAIARAVDDDEVSIEQLAENLITLAGDDPHARYQLVAPDLVERPGFAPFWQKERVSQVPRAVISRVKNRLLFDLAMEFGLQSRVGRTLELTSTMAARVDVDAGELEHLARVVCEDTLSNQLDGFDPSQLSSAQLVRWARGVLERMRERGAVAHPWFKSYLESDGRRYFVWGGRPRSVGMPAFPSGRQAPAFPRIGPAVTAGADHQKSHLDPVNSAQSWYAIWARKNLGVSAAEGAQLTRALFAALAEHQIVETVPISGGSATAYQLPRTRIVIRPVTAEELAVPATRLVCDVCASPVTSTAEVISQLAGGPCMSARCPGVLAQGFDPAVNFYRDLYTQGRMRRVVAREHTGLLTAETRLATENAFKSSANHPDSPNVLVATPTLEMGIDIGDLSTVMLAGLPRSTASYLQRVGRAGRLTGNALSLATVTGRDSQLPKLQDPLSVINGKVLPPATYLDAQEILQRQYLAALLDRRANIGANAPKLSAKDVLRSSDPGTLLGDLLLDAESHHTDRIAQFLSLFPGLAPSARDRLTEWATPHAGPGTSGLAASIRSAVLRWNAQITGLQHRKKEVEDALPELEAAVERGIDVDTAKTSLRTARATLRLLNYQLKELRTDYWIGALERFGLLPNYTLLDDTVELAASVSWVDPDTSEWHNDPQTYQRGAAIAIRELAPGSYFYAQGLEIPIDGVDLGPGGHEVTPWALCGSCGHSEPHSSTTPAQCPRCGEAGLNSTSQRFNVVELKTVTAVARRDEAAISDRRDDRKRTQFAVSLMADLNPEGIVSRWFDSGTGFGVTYANDLHLRWINLGKSGPGTPVRLAGTDVSAPLFRLCDTCGKEDQATGSNSPQSHRVWCARRNLSTEHTIALALSRTLVTQGVFLRLPVSIALGDSLAVPSLTAALLRGLREMIGGDPDHLRIIATREPMFAQDGSTAESLLVHDTVPGGTGYLAELADPERVHQLLTTAWDIVRTCACASSQQLSCVECLLPFAEGKAGTVSRVSAVQALETLLGVRDGVPQAFTPTKDDPGVGDTESVIEKLFRKKFIERAHALGASTTEIPGDLGPKIKVTFPDNPRLWMLSPQILVGNTRPDFVLEAHGGGATRIAIYTDGRQFHAVPGCNRLADDAGKRRGLRDQGYHVVAVTWADLTDQPMKHHWFDRGYAEKFAPIFGIPASKLDRFTYDPLTMIMRWLQDPDGEEHTLERAAAVLPALLVNGSAEIGAPERSPASLATLLLDGNPPVPSAEATTFAQRRDDLAHVTRATSPQHMDLAVMIDDRDATLGHVDFVQSWRLWLHLSNIATWHPEPSRVEVCTYQEVAAWDGQAAVGPIDVIHPAISVEWEQTLEHAGEMERPILLQLATSGLTSIPTVGLEAGDGIPLPFAWSDAQVTVNLDLTTGEVQALESSGWIVVEPTVEAIVHALENA